MITFQRRHYEWLADVLHDELLRGKIGQAFIVRFADRLYSTNPNYQLDKFTQRAINGTHYPKP